MKCFLGREDLITSFLTLGAIASMIGCAVAQPLAKRVCKIKAYIALQIISATRC
ncbi:hypothetical protein [Colwellia sp. MT41]|uniref:hypothetical protein n=1 Tax=Colwellia sp. MT41 TaxID=58049 RepID=UPI000AF86BD8